MIKIQQQESGKYASIYAMQIHDKILQLFVCHNDIDKAVRQWTFFLDCMRSQKITAIQFLASERFVDEDNCELRIIKKDKEVTVCFTGAGFPWDRKEICQTVPLGELDIVEAEINNFVKMLRQQRQNHQEKSFSDVLEVNEIFPCLCSEF